MMNLDRPCRTRALTWASTNTSKKASVTKARRVVRARIAVCAWEATTASGATKQSWSTTPWSARCFRKFSMFLRKVQISPLHRSLVHRSIDHSSCNLMWKQKSRISFGLSAKLCRSGRVGRVFARHAASKRTWVGLVLLFSVFCLSSNYVFIFLHDY